MARESFITTKIDGTTIYMTADLGGGRSDQIALNATALEEAIRTMATMHGLKQKLADAAAMPRDENGRPASVSMKWARVKQVRDMLLEGEWTRRGTGDGTGNAGLLFRALVRYYPNKEPDAIRTYLDGKDRAAQAKLRKIPAIAAIIDELRAETGGIDPDEIDELTNELDNL